RGRNQSEGDFVNVTPHRPAKAGPADVDESSDAYDTIDWLVKNVPGNNRRGGDRRAPRSEGRLAPGAGLRLVHRRRLPPQRRVLPRPRLPLLRQLRPHEG